MQEVAEMTGNKGLRTITEAEPIGPKGLLDVMVIAPCTGNSFGKTGGGDHGYAGAHGGKGAFAEQPSACHFHLDK